MRENETPMMLHMEGRHRKAQTATQLSACQPRPLSRPASLRACVRACLPLPGPTNYHNSSEHLGAKEAANSRGPSPHQQQQQQNSPPVPQTTKTRPRERRRKENENLLLPHAITNPDQLTSKTLVGSRRPLFCPAPYSMTLKDDKQKKFSRSRYDSWIRSKGSVRACV